MAMIKKIIVFTVTVTVIASVLFLFSNPILLSHPESDFAPNEVFFPVGDRYDFKVFSLNVSNSSNFTARKIQNGHVQLLSGDAYSINVLQFNRMLDFKAHDVENILERERKWPHETVDGVEVYTADFDSYKRYGSFAEKGNLKLYITSGSPQETAYMVNSLKFG